jgi:predicted outer membrane repeat protein
LRRSGASGDLLAVTLPANFAWPAILIDFLDIYDWDTIIIDNPVALTSKLDLCSGIFPCSLNVKGIGPAPALAAAGGSVSCLASAGCSAVVIDSIVFSCSSPSNSEPIFMVQGSSIVLHNTTVTRCSSRADGGLIFAYDSASVLISSSAFQSIYTMGYGSVLEAAGSIVLISESDFTNCSSAKGGGVVWATAYACTGFRGVIETEIHIESSRFLGCTSPGTGGAVLIIGDTTTPNIVALYTKSSLFQHCSSNTFGGAIYASGQSATIEVQASEFAGCHAAAGGAISIQGLALARVENSVFNKNQARRLGGGAIHSKDGKLVLVGLWGESNSAPFGGGGMIFWDSAAPPVFAPWCPEGSWGPLDSGAASQCGAQCANGTYQAACIACPAGKYNDLPGQSKCLSCPAGTFSTGTGAKGTDDCELCSPGTFSMMAATTCMFCPAGTFTYMTGASLCSHLPSKAQALPLNLTVGVIDPSPANVRIRQPDREWAPRTLVPLSIQRDSCVSEVRSNYCSDSATVSKRDLLRRKAVEVSCRSRVLSLERQSQMLESSNGLQNSICLSLGAVEGSNRTLRHLRSSFEMTNGLADLLMINSSGWCGMGNRALYGNCIASAFKKLDVLDPFLPIYAGITFTIAVQKLDAYNQTISPDSASVLEVHPSSNGDNPITILGPALVQMQAGIAEFTIALKLHFTRIDAKFGISHLLSDPEIFFEGSDLIESGTVRRMISSNFIIPAFVGHQACPLGYILNLKEIVGKARSGTCEFCAEGTYSINPLFGGSDIVSPACVSCPLQALQNNDCTKGGSVVNFSLGTWRVSDGLYTLVGCPKGYQLINKIDGLFSNQAQLCLKCGANSYILDSSNENYSCQPCPEFLICDQNQVRGRYSGGQISVDYIAGLYRLSGCPSGFEITSDLKDCSICPKLFYCTGGIAAKLPCPQRTFSFTGSNSSSSCVVSVFLSLVVLLPVSMQQFGIASQEKFVSAVSIATGLAADRVILVSVAPSSTLRSISGVNIQANLAIEDDSTASKVVSALDERILNDALIAHGLPMGQILKFSASDSVVVVTSSWDTGIIAGMVIAILVLVAAVLIIWLQTQKNESDSERLLRTAIESLRKRLGICKRDGFYLSYEAGPLWRRRNRTVYILRNEMEAAARLSLTQDFDVKSFDAFCQCIEYSSFVFHSIEYPNFVLSSGEEQPMPQPPQYDALCDWLLEVSRNLIEPDILKRLRDCKRPPADKDLESEILESERLLGAKQLFAYFKQRVAPVRLWLDHDRRLWQRLKRVAMDFTAEMALLFDARFDPHRILLTFYQVNN